MTESLLIQSEPNEELDGFGIRFSPFEHGDVWRRRVTNRGVGHQTYAPSGRIRTGERKLTLVGPGNELCEFRVVGESQEVRVTSSADIALLDGWPKLTTAEYKHPSWASGPWLSGTWRGLSARTVQKDLREAVESGVHFVGRLIDMGWYDHRAGLFSLSETFCSLPALIEEHRASGFQVMLWLAPWVPIGTPQWNHFKQDGWFVRDDSGQDLIFPVVGDASIYGSYLDFTVKSVSDAWANAIAKLCKWGARAFKLDFGEALPDSCRYRDEHNHTAISDVTVLGRNAYPLLMQAATLRGLEAECFVSSRSGWTGSEELTSNWLGDQSSDLSRFAGLGSAVVGLRSAISSGYQATGLDIGGYFGDPSEASMISWQRTAVLFETGFYHGLGERAPWRMGRKVLAAHQRLLEFAGVCEWSPDDQVVFGTTADGSRIAQRQGERHIAVADFGVGSVVQLPPGLWRDLEAGIEREGGCTVSSNGGSIWEKVDS